MKELQGKKLEEMKWRSSKVQNRVEENDGEEEEEEEEEGTRQGG